MVDRRMEGNKTLITDKETSSRASTNGVAYEEEEEAMESAAPKFAQLKATKRDLSGAIDATNAIPRRVGHRSNGGGGRRRSTRKRRGKTRRLADAAMNEHQHGEEQRHGDKSDNDVEQRHEEISLKNKREITVRIRKIENKQRNKRTIEDGTHTSINNDGDTDYIVRSQLRLRGQHETGVLSKKRGMEE